MKAKKILAAVIAAAAVSAMMMPVSAAKANSGAPNEKEVIALINKSTDRNILYNAEKSGLTANIIRAFIGGKAGTLEAGCGSYSIELNREYISDENALTDVDISASEKKILTDKKINKLKAFKNSAEVIQINLNGSGGIKGIDRFNIRTRLRTKLTGPADAVVYEYKNKKIRKFTEVSVDKNGNISFSTDHLGKYIISVETAESVSDKSPSEKDVIKLISESKGGNVLYDAKKAGLTKEIISAFLANEKADSLEARVDKFSIELNRDDVSDKTDLKDIDMSLSNEDVLTEKQIKKYKSLRDSREIIQLNFNAGGKISGINRLKLHTRATELIDNSKAAVYEMADGKLKKITDVSVNEQGDIFFTADHLGKFVIAVK